MLLLLVITKCGALWPRKFVSLIAYGHQTLTSYKRCVCADRDLEILLGVLREACEIHRTPRKRSVMLMISFLCGQNWLTPYEMK